VVIAELVLQPTGRAVCQAFVAALRRYGVPAEVLSDNGKQFTGRFTKPRPAEVLFERLCRDNGITQRLTKRRSPTTTGKIERWHRTLREELLDQARPFASFAAAQEAINAWVHSYNHQRPHQALEMGTPAGRFRPSGLIIADGAAGAGSAAPKEAAPAALLPAISPALAAPATASAVELEFTVPPGGIISLAGHQQVWLGPAYAGRMATIWADDRSVHVILAGHHLKTVPSRLNANHLHQLRLRGARPAGPPPAAPVLPPGNARRRLPPGTAVEVDRLVQRDGVIQVGNQSFTVHPDLVGQRIILRLDDHLMHAIANGHLIKTWPLPIDASQRIHLRGARAATSELPPPPSSLTQAAQRRVPADGVVMVARQRLRIGRTHAGKIVTIIAEDTHFRVQHQGQELSIRVRRRYSTRDPAEVTGYAVALPDDTTRTGGPVWYSGGKLAPDLTLPKLRHDWAIGGATSRDQFTPADRDAIWEHATQAASRATAEIRHLAGTHPGAAADAAWAASDTLHAAA
jgi:hypothetical protein